MSRSESSAPPPVNRRGTACLNCRRRKVRCDIQRPVCGPCIRISAADMCEYADSGPSRTQILEETISSLQARISELETRNAGAGVVPFGSSGDPADVQLEGLMPMEMDLDPEVTGGSLTPAALQVTQSQVTTAGPAVAPYVPVHQTPAPDLQSILITPFEQLEEPPEFIVRILLHQFVHYAQDVGFFLNIGRFRESALRRAPPGDHSRPTPALLSAVYLWATHLSSSAMISSHEPQFLNEAVQLSATTLTTDHPHRVIHAIQAAVLLSLYFFHSGRILEGKLHASTAASLIFFNNFHDFSYSRAQNLSLDPVEEGERVNALWTVFILNNSWSGAVGFSTGFPYSDPRGRITVPWPLPMQQYEQGERVISLSLRPTVNDFLTGVQDENNSPLALYARASIVFERSSHVFAQSSRITVPDLSHVNSSAFITLENLTRAIQSSLPALRDVMEMDACAARAMTVTHALAYAATIQLHRRFTGINPPSENACILAALAISRWTEVVSAESSSVYVNPILAMIWSDAGQILMKASGNARTRTDDDELHAAIERVATAMARFAPHSALLRYQFTKMQEAFAGSMTS